MPFWRASHPGVSSSRRASLSLNEQRTWASAVGASVREVVALVFSPTQRPPEAVGSVVERDSDVRAGELGPDAVDHVTADAAPFQSVADFQEAYLRRAGGRQAVGGIPLARVGIETYLGPRYLAENLVGKHAESQRSLGRAHPPKRGEAVGLREGLFHPFVRDRRGVKQREVQVHGQIVAGGAPTAAATRDIWTTRLSVPEATLARMTETTDSAASLCPAAPTARPGSGENPRHNVHDATPVSAGSVIGYARVSTADQVLDRQTDALREVGCDRVFTDHGVSGTVASRPGLDACLEFLRPGDTLVVQSLDRLGRRTSELLRLVDQLRGDGVSLRILNLGIDTGTPAGNLMLTLASALSQMEAEVTRERTIHALRAARARGRVGGRPRLLSDEQVQVASEWRTSGRSWTEIARLLGTSERTVRRRVGDLPRPEVVVTPGVVSAAG